MKFIKYLLFLTMMFNAQTLFGFSPPNDRYFIWNKSNDPIYITSRIRQNNFEHIDFAHVTSFSFTFYLNDIYITNIKSINIFQVERRKFFPSDNNNIFDPRYSYPVITFLSNLDLALDPRQYSHLFHYIFEELIIYDHEGYIIITLDDINTDSFTVDKSFITLRITQEVVDMGRKRHAGAR